MKTAALPLIIFLALTARPLFSQITFTSADLPGIGDVVITASDTLTTTLAPGPTGPNQTWDFSQLTAQDTLALNVVDPASTPETALFPDATLALQSGSFVTYLQVTADAVLNLGAAGDTIPEVDLAPAIRFMPPGKLFELPTDVNTSFTQAYGFLIAADGSIVDESGLVDSVRLVQAIEDTVMTDGYGTLTTPAGTFETLRLHLRSTTTMTLEVKAFGFWQEFSSDVTRQEQYTWIAKETDGIALSISYNSETGEVENIDWWVDPGTPVAPNAAFTYVDQGEGQLVFSDLSTNEPTSWLWDFGDGNTSTQQNPTHTYAADGAYTVCLTVMNADGSDTVCEIITVITAIAPEAAFSFEDQGAGQIAFTDNSTNEPTAWMWNFGDGNTSNEQNPTHTYAADGAYTVCLTASNAAGESTACQQISVITAIAPIAAFSFDDQGAGQVAFTDNSTNEPTAWMWDFGDGNTSNEQNPTHTYAADGAYTVCLTVMNAAGENTSCQEINVITAIAPIAAFSFDDQGAGQVAFTDNSTNEPTAWMWDFGDGNTSNEQNPNHTFVANGTYNVCLTVMNAAGENTSCQEITVTVTSTYALEREYGFRLYPNPATTIIRLEKRMTGEQPFLVRFFHSNGQAVHTARLNEYIDVDVRQWPAGLYVFSVHSESGRLLGSGRVQVE